MKFHKIKSTAIKLFFSSIAFGCANVNSNSKMQEEEEPMQIYNTNTEENILGIKKIIVVGCGQNFEACYNGVKVFHDHKNAITIDPNENIIPDLVGSFPECLENFPCSYFEKITLECAPLSIFNSLTCCSELLKPGATLEIVNGQGIFFEILEIPIVLKNSDVNSYEGPEYVVNALRKNTDINNIYKDISDERKSSSIDIKIKEDNAKIEQFMLLPVETRIMSISDFLKTLATSKKFEIMQEDLIKCIDCIRRFMYKFGFSLTTDMLNDIKKDPYGRRSWTFIKK